MKKLLLVTIIFFSINKINGMDDPRGTWKFNLEKLQGLDGERRKAAIQAQCDGFKKRSEHDKEGFLQITCTFKDEDFAKKFFNELDIEYIKKIDLSEKQRDQLVQNIKLYTALQKLQYEYNDRRINPYKKKLKTNINLEYEHEKENTDYDYALFSLKFTKKVMEHNWSNVSWLQWLWNYRAYKNYQKSIQTLDEWIAQFNNQDEVVSSKKTVFDRGAEISLNESMLPDNIFKEVDVEEFPGKLPKMYLKKKVYTKPKLTHREVFTRSSMPRTMFEQVKAARE